MQESKRPTEKKRAWSRWYVPFLVAVFIAFLCLVVYVIFPVLMESEPSPGWILKSICGTVLGLIAGWVLLLFEWIERSYETAKQQKHLDNERILQDGQPVAKASSRLAVVMFILACATFWVPLLGIAITGYAVYLAGRDDLPGFVGCLEVCLLLASITTTLVAIVIIGCDFLAA